MRESPSGPRPLYHLICSKEGGAPALAIQILTGRHGMYLLNAAHAELRGGLDENGSSFARLCVACERLDVLREVTMSDFSRRLAKVECRKTWADLLATDIKLHGPSVASYFWLAQHLHRFGMATHTVLRELVYLGHAVYPDHEDAEALLSGHIGLIPEFIRRARQATPLAA